MEASRYKVLADALAQRSGQVREEEKLKELEKERQRLEQERIQEEQEKILLQEKLAKEAEIEKKFSLFKRDKTNLYRFIPFNFNSIDNQQLTLSKIVNDNLGKSLTLTESQ